MKKLTETKKLVQYNWKQLVGFEIIYKLSCVLFFIPVLWNMFDLIMKVGGYSYLTIENIVSFLSNPLVIPLLVILIILAAICAMIDISAIIFTLDQSKQKNTVHVWQIIKFSVKNAARAWNPRNFLLVVVVLLLLPFLNIGMASSVLTTISIPEFILDYIDDNAWLSAVFAAASLLFIVLMIKWLYAFHYFTLEGCHFKEARKKSRQLAKGKGFGDFVLLLFVQFMFLIFYFLFLFASIAFVTIIGKIFSEIFILYWIASTILWMAIIFSLIAVMALATPVSYACVSVLYYKHKEETGEKVIHSKALPCHFTKGREQFLRRCSVIFGVVIVTTSLVLGFLFCSGKISPKTEYIHRVEITAHRGASAVYPENTMAAFYGAKELGADWIELDVQQSKDGQIIVMHDTNFKRTTGVDAGAWELDYKEIVALDAGSFFDAEFAGERIPLLYDVALFAKENQIKLNIELKPTGHETDFEQNVLDVIYRAGIEEFCVITSQVYQVLENVKAYDPSMKTVYVMSLAYGNINQLAAADHFSVEATSATRNLIARVHNAGKQIYVWTVNTKETIDKMIELGVDNIITDNISLAKQCVFESRYSDLLVEFIKFLE